MDTLSATTAAGCVKLPATTSRELHHATTSLLAPPHPHHYNLSSPKSAATRRRSLTRSTSIPAAVLSAKSHLRPQPLPFHRKAATGYAAALLDSAQFAGFAALSAVARDVRRFSKLLKREEIRDFIGDASMVKLIADKGKFHPQVKTLLNLLIQKGKIGIFGEVLDEFEGIYQLLAVASSN